MHPEAARCLNKPALIFLAFPTAQSGESCAPHCTQGNLGSRKPEKPCSRPLPSLPWVGWPGHTTRQSLSVWTRGRAAGHLLDSRCPKLEVNRFASTSH